MQQELVANTINLGALAPHERLRVRIAVANLRQFEVSGRAGISESVLSRVLSGRKEADEELVTRISRAIDELVSEAAA